MNVDAPFPLNLIQSVELKGTQHGYAQIILTLMPINRSLMIR